MSIRFGRYFVAKWSDRYQQDDKRRGGKENDLMMSLHPRVAVRGFFTKVELERVGDWKAARNRVRLSLNSDDDVREISRLALVAPERLQHRILGLLRGVRDPMASALLTVWAPSRHTVIDFRAVEALQRLKEIGAIRQELPFRRGGRLPEYLSYLRTCRSIAHDYKISLRDLDRALWMWSKSGLPG